MDKQIITFSANEQNLVRIGGEYHYSSNKVSYIGAHFDLGANWDGFDSVRAVWFTDRINGISTVPDGEGNCTVPTEVLKKKDRVFVNLVGSIVSNGELTDRLTTYPAVALVVDSKAKVDSTETAPVTPSQFEQFVSIVQDAVANIKDIVSTTLNADYTLTFVYSDGTSYTTPSIRGERGPQGADGADGVTPNISIGNVETLEPSQDAYVTRRGTDDNPIFDFGIPKGDKGDTGEVTMSQLSSLLPTDTASGSIASFPDGTDLFPALSVKAQIEPIQDLHGYDKPWSGGAGKNLFGGVYGQKYELHIPNGATVTAYADKACTLAYYEADGTTRIDYWSVATEVAGGYTRTFTMIGDSSYFMFLGVSDPPTKMYIAIENSFSGYTPYSNICPISGHTECVTEVCGVNVWDEEWEVGIISTANGINGASTTNIRSKNYIPVIGGVTYYFKCVGGYVLYYDADNNYISYEWKANQTFTPPTTARYARFYVTSGYGTTYNHDISINYPSTDHDYHAYQGDTYTTTLGRTVYGGTLDVVSGELVVDRAMVDLGTLDWAYESGRDLFEALLVPRAKSLFDAVCSNYPFVGSYSVLVDKSCGYIYGYHIAVKDSTYGTDATAFKSAMNGVQLAYELATPQTYQLDPQTIDLLLGQNNLWTDCGSVEVTYKADVGLYIDKKLSSNSTRSLSMGLTKSATAEAETETEPSKVEVETKAEETKTEASKTETETEAVEAKTETDKSETR